MLDRVMLPQKKRKVDEEAQKAKDVAKLFRAVHTIRTADELRAKGIKSVEEEVAKYPDLAGLVDVVMPTKIIVDMVQNITADPSVSSKQSKLPTIVDLNIKKVHPTSKVNMLGICIFYCPMCPETFKNHGTADAHICEEYTKIKYGPCSEC